MQFGRLHGTLFLLLGLMLVFAQCFMMAREAHSSRVDPARNSVEAQPRPKQNYYIAGVSGLISIGIGAYLLAQKRENAARTT